jgi:GNAT superfamily N-acetyltransferase
MSQVTIRPYTPADAAAFKTLNLAWIERHFGVEPQDLVALDNPGAILDAGGAMLIAAAQGEAVGTCALIPHGAGTLELAKMTVSEALRGAGLGRALMDAAVATARALGARRLYLESNASLTAAVTLYERTGFRHLAPEERPVSPYARAGVFMEMLL